MLSSGEQMVAGGRVESISGFSQQVWIGMLCVTLNVDKEGGEEGDDGEEESDDGGEERRVGVGGYDMGRRVREGREGGERSRGGEGPGEEERGERREEVKEKYHTLLHINYLSHNIQGIVLYWYLL